MAATSLAHAVAEFYEGARGHALGALLSNNTMIKAAFKTMKNALSVIDATSENGRDILLPFLDNPDSMVRCEAAQALYPTRRDLALPILHDIHIGCVTEASWTAGTFLLFAGEPNHDSDLMKSYPTKFEDSFYQAALRRI